MKLKVLGCGTSTGVPVPGCRCRICTSEDPKNHRSRTSSVITTDRGQNILIDATTDLRYQALQNDVRNVDAVFYTHPHSDHILGTDDLRVFNFVKRGPIPCYGTADTLNYIREFFSYIFRKDPLWEGGLLADLTLHPVIHGEAFEALGIPVVPFLLNHGSTPVTGYRVGELAYATDCKTIPHESKEILKGVKYLLLDGLRYEEHPTHLTLDQAVEVARELGVDKTYLIHMSHNLDFHETNSKLPPDVQLAYDGQTIEFRLT